MNVINTLKTAFLGSLLLAGAAFAGAPVDVNTANAEQLAESLDGVGMSKAAAIVAYRSENGPFKHADEMINVKGIGLRTVDRNREFIQLGSKPTVDSTKK